MGISSLPHQLQGNGKLKLIDIIIKDFNGNVVSSINMGMSFSIEVIIQKNLWSNSDKINELAIGINDEFGQRIIVMNNVFINKNISINNDLVRVVFKISKCPLNIGIYGLAFYLSDEFNVIDWIDNASNLVVEEGDYYNTGRVNRKGLGKILVDYDLEQN